MSLIVIVLGSEVIVGVGVLMSRNRAFEMPG
jgi:hypothetical protein